MSLRSHHCYHRSPEEQFHSFSTIGEEELYKLVKSSKPTTCMLDPIPSKLLKEVLPEVIDPLLAIINSSLSLGYVPKTFKLAVIKPLIKKPQLDPKDLVNYRPISNLPFLSKMLEKVVSSQLYSFIEKNGICEDFQSAFRIRIRKSFYCQVCLCIQGAGLVWSGYGVILLPNVESAFL